MMKENKTEKEITRKERLKEKARKSALRFRQELRKSVTTAIVAAFGFLIALSWKEVITSWVEKISEATPIKGNLISALIVTIISVIGILIISKWNNEEKTG